jgi:AcrR family transcriptional regulator
VVLRRRAGWSYHPAMKTTVRPKLLEGEDLPAEPRQKRSREKRARLKAAALALFGEKGYEGTSIEEIARRANLAVGGFYQHFRSKRQLLLALMDELLEGLSGLDLRAKFPADVRAGLRALLSSAFSRDLRYLGAYRAWQEAVLSDADLARKQNEIQAWTTTRVTNLFKLLQQLPGARLGVDIQGLARAMDSFFWNLLTQAVLMPKVELERWIDASTHLIYHALFTDVNVSRRVTRSGRVSSPPPISRRRSP